MTTLSKALPNTPSSLAGRHRIVSNEISTRGVLADFCEERGDYLVRFAHDDADRRSAQRLRYEVFAREMGARVEGAELGLDLDPLDEVADHLLVIERATGDCVGSYRLVTRAALASTDDFYTRRIFDLSKLPDQHLEDGVELGRACVDLRHRTRGVLQLLLRGIGEYLVRTEKRFLFGCGSVPLKDPAQARLTISEIEKEGWFDPALKVGPTPDYQPRFPDSTTGASPEIPALLYAYCAIGARLAASPAYDADFGTLDFFVLLDLEAVHPRTYARYCGQR
jgi:putative hemolysin